MADKVAVRELIEKDPEFIWSKRFNYSIEPLLVRYPGGCPDRIIAQVLLLEEKDVDRVYENILVKIRSLIGVIDD